MSVIDTAINRFNQFQAETKSRNKSATFRILYPEADDTKIRSCLNDLKKAKEGNVNCAKLIINAIDDYNKNINKNSFKEMYFSDLYEFFISKNVYERFSENEALKVQGWYLLFRKSNVCQKIIVSYLHIVYKENTLTFKTERNNLNASDDPIGAHVKTEGIIIANTDKSYFCIGISKGTYYIKPFIETMTLYIDNGYNVPISAYWSGFIAQGSDNTAFVGKVVLIKIKQEESIEKVNKEIDKLDDDNQIIKLHEKSDLLDSKHIINQIIEKEQSHIKMEKILSNLKMKPDDTSIDFLRLSRFI